jgi:hypothetical protein
MGIWQACGGTRRDIIDVTGLDFGGRRSDEGDRTNGLVELLALLGDGQHGERSVFLLGFFLALARLIRHHIDGRQLGVVADGFGLLGLLGRSGRASNCHGERDAIADAELADLACALSSDMLDELVSLDLRLGLPYGKSGPC